MAESDSPNRSPHTKRRKLRKGTFSCRECKQRKRRCELLPGQPECAGCRKRGLPCLSQDDDDSNQITYQEVEERINHVEGLVDDLVHRRQALHPRPPCSVPAIPILSTTVPRPLSRSSISIVTYLKSIYPSPSEASVILSHGKSSRMPTRVLWSSNRNQTQNEGYLPPSDVHPVWFGRHLMKFALCLQDRKTASYDGSYFADIVSQHITSLDVMIDSAEGIEVLMLEAMYYVNADNRRVAWLKCRRAISIAQMLGIDGGRDGEYANSLWFRLLYGDRIMSMELGLPYTVLTQDLMHEGDPVKQLENAHISLGARIIARNLRMQRQDARSESRETLDIESKMKEAAGHLPSTWWDVEPHLSTLTEERAMAETAKLTTQMNHFWIFKSIYQPYLADGLVSSDSTNEILDLHLRVTYATRELLRRFLALRRYHHGTLYHGLDFKAYSASIDLLLAQIIGRNSDQCDALESATLLGLDLIREVLNYMDDEKMSQTTGLTIRELRKAVERSVTGAETRWAKGKTGGKGLHIPFVGVFTTVKC